MSFSFSFHLLYFPLSLPPSLPPSLPSSLPSFLHPFLCPSLPRPHTASFYSSPPFSTPQVGSEWSDVVELIRKAHYQPLLLVYADRFASPVDTSNAPTETKLVSFGEPTSSSSMPTVVEEKEEEGEKKGDLPTNQITAAVGSDSQLTNHIHTSTSQSPANATTGQPTNQIATSQVGQQPTNRIAAATQQLRVTEAIDPLTLSIVPAARLYPQSSGELLALILRSEEGEGLIHELVLKYLSYTAIHKI